MNVNRLQSSDGTIRKYRRIQQIQADISNYSSFSDGISDTEENGLINDTAILSRSKRRLKIKLNEGKKGNKGKKGTRKPSLLDRLNTKKNRESARDVIGEAVDDDDEPPETEISIEELNLELIKAVKQSNLSIVTVCINEGADINTKDIHGQTPLHIASKKGYADIAKFLLDKGADINAQENKLGQTPLHLAAARGNLEIVKYLVASGADVDVYQGGGGYSTPLHFAAKKSHMDIVKFLIENGANPDAKDGDGKTPLQRAAQKGLSDIVDYLQVRMRQVTEEPQITQRQQIEEETQTADIQQVTETPQTTVLQQVTEVSLTTDIPVATERQHITTETTQVTEDYSNISLHLAAEQGNLNAVRYFVEKGENINSKDRESKTPLCLAAQNGYLDIVKYLIDKGASINVKRWRDDDFSALPYAVESGNLDLVKYLVDKGADINARDNDRYTPLHRAALKGKLDIVKYLVEKGAEINVKAGYYSETPLENAVDKDNLGIVKYLLENGADIGSEDRKILRLAIREGDLDLVKNILEKGTSVNISMGKTTLLQIAIEEEQFDIAIFLVDKGADIRLGKGYGHVIFLQAVKKDSVDLVKAIVRKQRWYEDGVNTKNPFNNETALHIAAGNGNLEMVKYLIDEGARINDEYKIGTPLHFSVRNDNLDLVKYLVDAGADIHIKDGDGNTPLHLAAGNGFLDIVKYLLEKGADPKATDNRGKIPEQKAGENCHLGIVNYFKEVGHQVTGEIEDTDKDRGQVTEGQQVTEESLNACEQDNTSLHLAAERGYLRIVKCLIANGTDINAKDESGLAPLHVAAMYGTMSDTSLAVVKYLVENGADINVRSGTSNRHLTLTNEGLDRTVTVHSRFLTDGVGTDKKPKQGRTPLHYAAIHGNTRFEVVNGRIEGGCLRGGLAVVKYLVENGADITAEDEDGKAPLDLAKTRCHEDPEVIQLLSFYRCDSRTRRDLSSNSLMHKGVVNRDKVLIPSIGSTGSLSSREHDNHAATAASEINTLAVNNTLILGILAAGLFNKTQQRQSLHENLLTPRQQLMRNIDESSRMLKKSLRKGKEKGWDIPNIDVEFHDDNV